MPESAFVVYDECLEIDDSRFTQEWYAIFRCVQYHRNSRIRQNDPSALVVIPYRAEQSIMGFGLWGVYIGKELFDTALLYFNVEQVADREAQGLLASDHIEINISGTMTAHLMDLTVRYQDAVDKGIVLDQETRSL